MMPHGNQKVQFLIPLPDISIQNIFLRSTKTTVTAAHLSSSQQIFNAPNNPP